MIGRTSMGAGKEEQEKTVSITTNGTVEIVPDTNKTLSKVTANVNVLPTASGINSNRVGANTSSNNYNITISSVVDQLIHVVALRINSTNPFTISATGASLIKHQPLITNNSSFCSSWFIATSTSVTISVYNATAGFEVSIN